jgi:hypothetical protein
MWIVPFSPCTSSPERAAACLPTSSSACNPSAPSKSRTSPQASSPSDSPVSRSGTTCRHSAPTTPTAPTHSLGSAPIEQTSALREASRAKTFLLLASSAASTAREAVCGASSREYLARFDRASRSWRTPPTLFGSAWDEFSATWPRWGMMLDGTCYPLPPWAPDTNGSGCGFPLLCGTPRALEWGEDIRSEAFRSGVPTPCELLRERFPTPNARDWRGGSVKPHGLGQENLNDLAVRRSRLRAPTTPSPQEGANLK